MKEQIWPCPCQFSWDSFSSTLLFPSFTLLLLFFLLKPFQQRSRKSGSVWNFLFFTILFCPCSIHTQSLSMGPQCRAVWRTYWCKMMLFFPPMGDGSSAWWKLLVLRSFGENDFPILCRKGLYWRWVSALSSKNGVWIGLGCNRGLSAVISSATAPGQSIPWETSWTFQVSLRIRIDPHAVLFLLFHLVCHRLLRYVLILPSLDSPLF